MTAALRSFLCHARCHVGRSKTAPLHSFQNRRAATCGHANAMPEETSAPPSKSAKRRLVRRGLLTLAAVMIVFAAWHWGYELPAERRAAAELKIKQAENARR